MKGFSQTISMHSRTSMPYMICRLGLAVYFVVLSICVTACGHRFSSGTSIADGQAAALADAPADTPIDESDVINDENQTSFQTSITTDIDTDKDADTDTDTDEDIDTDADKDVVADADVDAVADTDASGDSLPLPIGHMELEYAEKFSVDYYEGDIARITIDDEQFFLLLDGSNADNAETGAAIGNDTPSLRAAVLSAFPDLPVLQQPVNEIYLASSSAMDLFLQTGALDSISMTSTRSSDWTIPEIRQAISEGTISYVGKYNAPDFETVLANGCGLAIENTMIYHSPETKEKLEALGIPVMVERSSYEAHPLGRVEWIKLYGLLTGHLEEAERFFAQSIETVNSITGQEATTKTVSFFYITSSGYANVRKPGDYISKMITLAGGQYLFPQGIDEGDSALTTLNMDLETFYASVKDADILIYNSTTDGELSTMAELLGKSPLFADFKAVKNGNVWCTRQNMFQQVSGTTDMITDFNAILHDDSSPDLKFLHKLWQ